MSSIKVVVVSDDDLFRQKVDALLEFSKNVTVVGEARNEGAALGLIDRTQPDVVLLDISPLCAAHSQTAVARILTPFPRVKIIVFHGDGQERLVLDALKAGAWGHLARQQARPDEIVAAIRAVKRGDVVLSARVAGSMLDELVRRRLDR
jgi:DNA-binding NarL/FixJ family response regulator